MELDGGVAGAADAAEDDALMASLRVHRPAGPEPSSLEQRLAIAAILSASGFAPALQRIGRLEVQSRIGGGAMGVVYRAWDPHLERVVAVKVLRGRSESDDARVADEARALARLSHPNVVSIFDIVREGGEVCFVMEYVAGRTLRAWLDEHPEASWREVVEWFVQAGHGIVAAHDAGIVHQDLKPENILIGDDGRARVVDFGLSRWDTASLDEGNVGGTPHYMAPEVSLGRAATALSDQYSFCIALRDALVGKAAPPTVVADVERGLSAAPEARHARMGILVGGLERALADPAEDRARKLLLDRVERLWLGGVLDRSLEDGGAIDLALHAAPHLIKPPWQDWGVEGGVSSTRAHRLQHALHASHGSLLLVGPPGSGKTTLLLLLCRELWRTASLEADAPAPVVLSLSTYEPLSERAPRAGHAQSEHFAGWIVDELVAKYGLGRPAVRRWLDASGIVLLLDGLDETDASVREKVVETLNHFRAERPLSMVVTCRDSEYEALGSRLSFGGALAVQPLDDEGVAGLIEARHASASMTRLAQKGQLQAHLRNPLLLTLLARGGELDETSNVPPWALAYGRYVERALDRAPADERAALTAQLSFLARAMRAHSTSDLWIERLHFGWLERRWERAAAWIMGAALVLVVGVGLNVLQVPLTGNSMASALVFGVGVSVSSFAYTRGQIKPVESLRWSWRRMVRLLPITTICATIVGLAEALRINFAANLVGAGLTGAYLAVAFALDAGDRAGKVRPNAGIRRSLAFAFATSFGLGIPAGLLFGLVVHPYIRRPLIDVPEGVGDHQLMVGVSVGLFVFTALFLIYGGFTVLMHYVLRLWIAWRTPLPLDLPRMLDRAVELGLMRRVGGGYVFLHRTLLDYFADQR